MKDFGFVLLIYIAAAFFLGAVANFASRRIPRVMDAEWAAEQAGDEDPNSRATRFFGRRAQCHECDAELMPLRCIPLIGRFFGNQCHACGATIFAVNWVTDSILVAAAIGLAFKYGPSIQGAALLVFAAGLVSLALIDLRTMLLPDRITLPMVWAGLLYNLHAGPDLLRNAVLGAVFGYLFLWLMYHGFKWATGKEGLGYGDFKLLAAIGAVLGIQALPGVLFLSSIVGCVAGLTAMYINRESKPYPFGPYLAAAGLIAIFVPPLSQWL